jgi:broad specificity phosphatase PhoE
VSVRGIFVSHPEVEIDPAVPVPRWHLAPVGITRMRCLAADPSIAGLAAIWASDETKAIEAAGILAGRFGLPVQVHPGLAEMDRSSTGYRPQAEFEGLAWPMRSLPTRMTASRDGNARWTRRPAWLRPRRKSLPRTKRAASRWSVMAARGLC